MMIGWFPSLVSLLVFLCLALLQSANATDTILQGQTITYPETIVSSGGKFEVGFFSPGNTSKYYLGIWHTVSKLPIVWVANREYPLLSASSNLTINSEGQLVISNGRILYEVTDINTKVNNKTYATLLDSGNLVLLDQVSLEILWESFDHPTDTILPGMNLGYDRRFGNIGSLVSWRSPEDPALGNFSLTLTFGGLLVVRRGSKIYWNDTLEGFENHRTVPRAIEGNVTWGTLQSSGISHMVLDAFGQLIIEAWSEDDQRWHTLVSSKCSYTRCGAFSVCNIMADTPCSCLRGFRQFSRNQPSTEGCVRKTILQCDHNQNYSFYEMKYVDYPRDQGVFNVTNELECRSACSRRCTCLAYAVDDKQGCLAWFSDLYDLKQLANNDANNKTFYLKLPESELTSTDSISTNGRTKDTKTTSNKMQLWTIIILTISLSMLMLGLFIYYIKSQLQVRGEDLLKFDLAISLKADDTELTETNTGTSHRKPEVKLPLFTFASVSAATDKFSAANKLGEGGFGPVYKGILLKGDEIAVKRLSKRSGQGWEELKNEALVIAKLQHKNLVRL
ncbi:hypothetical protein PTKIN_Ptkin11bG0161700 [Pterospermum kingtungense]